MMKIYNVMLVNLVADDECKKREDEDRAEPQALITNQYKKCMQVQVIDRSCDLKFL